MPKIRTRRFDDLTHHMLELAEPRYARAKMALDMILLAAEVGKGEVLEPYVQQAIAEAKAGVERLLVILQEGK